MSLHIVWVFLGLMIAGPSTIAQTPPKTQAARVAWNRLETSAFNQLLDKGSRANEAWARNPITIALQFLGESEDLPASRTIVMSKVRLDRDDAVVVVVTDDGLADDSVRGEKHRLEFKRIEPGRWTLAGAFKAWRCQPRRGHADYSAKPCS